VSHHGNNNLSANDNSQLQHKNPLYALWRKAVCFWIILVNSRLHSTMFQKTVLFIASIVVIRSHTQHFDNLKLIWKSFRNIL
jgi:hypothetical protein